MGTAPALEVSASPRVKIPSLHPYFCAYVKVERCTSRVQIIYISAGWSPVT